MAGRNLIFHDRDHPSQLLVGTRLPCVSGCPGAHARRCARRLTVHLPKRLRRARVTVAGHRLRVRHRGRRLVVLVRPKAGARYVTLRIRGVDRHGRHVKLRRRYKVCR